MRDTQITTNRDPIRAASAQHRAEVSSGNRFEFGKNWGRFLRTLTDQRIALAEGSLRNMLKVDRLDGRTFLDVGSGSGLFSLAARRLGARVHSFDYDPDSVACTTLLRDRYFRNSPDWVVEQGSVLDKTYLERLGTFDIVYSWGVLHHTGAMWRAFENVKPLVRQSGQLFIAIYNDQGAVTDRWAEIKRRYNALPRPAAFVYALAIIGRCEWPQVRHALTHAKIGAWLDQWRSYADTSTRGMSRWHDWIDWIGGYPYERATIEQVVDTFARDGFRLMNLFDCSGGYGCNEFVFTRDAAAGTWVDSRIPAGASFTRRHAYRVNGPFEQRADGYYGTTQAPLAHSSTVLFRNGRLVGAALCQDGKVKVAPLSDPPQDTDVFQMAAAAILAPTEPFRHVRGCMWAWSVPAFEAVADNAPAAPNGSPLYVFEDGVQLAYPRAMHDDIAQHGNGRYSHWGTQVYFAPRTGGDPNAARERFKLVIATEHLPAALQANLR